MADQSLFRPTLRLEHYAPYIVAYYFKQWDGFHMDYHVHNAAEIMYVIQGSGRVETEDAAVELRKGDFILLDAGVTHRLIVQKDRPCRMLNIEFVFREKAGAMPSIRDLAEGHEELSAFLSNKRPFVVLSDPSDVYHTLKNVVWELDQYGDQRSGMVQLQMSQLFIRIARLAAQADRENMQADSYVEKAVAFMHQHYDCDIQVKDMASAVNVHPGYLHRIFKQKTGRTLIEYLAAFRMEKAKMLLSQTDISITQIPDYIGLNSSQYFSTVFKKYTGTTPAEYRKSQESWRRDISES
ncbi:AraC family transcriptional regulator [Marinicrinis lubricantis]|uniref:Helix-turn-helix domain-containing protein n=1 Tax=Marinicrinis lubricantis TaxID=2086470 RepID=A0ABW1IQV8_9BACL